MQHTLSVGCLALLLGALGSPLPVLAAGTTAPTPAATSATYTRLADEMEVSLQQQIVQLWFPRAVDSAHGGFYENYDEHWARTDNGDKSLVYQSRLTWVAAKIAMRAPAPAADLYRGYSNHGMDYLKNVLWDPQYGGFFWQVDAQGHPTAERGGEKHVYGIAFAIYAASANYQATHDPRALALAKRAFLWLDDHAHDAKNGGYYEALTQQGKPILTPSTASGANQSDAIGTRYGFKSMNSHIHLLEAFTALYQVWPDPQVRKRLDELFGIVRDKIAVKPGCLNMFFTPDWKPVPDSDSFGHDVETSYLLTEAAAALGKPDDAKTRELAREIVDHALDFGWDTENGGFYDRGSAFEAATGLDKIWWTQAEGLNALLMMHARYGRETPRYWEAFLREWDFIRAHQIDAVNGGWLTSVSRAGVPVPGQAKSDPWKDPYHQSRALMNVIAELRRLAAP